MQKEKKVHQLANWFRRHPVRNSAIAVIVVLISVGNIKSRSDIEPIVNTTSTSSTIPWSPDSTDRVSYEECLAFWETPASEKSSLSWTLDSDCFSIRYFCDEYRTLQRRMKTLESDISLGFAIPSDATDAILEFAPIDELDLMSDAEEDNFRQISVQIKSAYRALRVAFLKGQDVRADGLLKRIASLKVTTDSLCQPVPYLDN